MIETKEGDVLLSLQELADLRHLISIAVWIRSAQLAQPGAVRLIRSGQVEVSMPPVELDTRDLSLSACHADMVHGQRYWERITKLLEGADALPAQAFWRKVEGAS